MSAKVGDDRCREVTGLLILRLDLREAVGSVQHGALLEAVEALTRSCPALAGSGLARPERSAHAAGLDGAAGRLCP